MKKGERLSKWTSIDSKHPHYQHLVYKNPLFHFILIADEFGGVPTTMTKAAEVCSMSRQEFRTRMHGYADLGLLSVHTTKQISKTGGQKINVSRIILNLEHPLFIADCTEKEITHTKTNLYPPEFEEDWGIYRGKSDDKIGSKQEAFVSWIKSTRKYGRSIVMRGTSNYVAECESQNRWKKNGSTWFHPKEARFLEDVYQKNDSPHVALWKLLNSPVLGNILEGGYQIIIKDDPYMAESLINLKGTDRVLGQTLDRLKDRNFRESFISSYEDAMKTESPRNNLYAQYEHTIEWSVNEQESREGNQGGENSNLLNN